MPSSVAKDEGARRGPTTVRRAEPAQGMFYRISPESDFLRAELYDRRTAEETREFLEVVAHSALKHRTAQILIVVRSSNPIFTLGRSIFFEQLRPLVTNASHRIALLGNSQELVWSHQYIEMLGRQMGINVRSFSDEPAALRWLRGQA